MINLCLVVIATQFSETKKRETAKMKAEREKFSSTTTLSTVASRSAFPGIVLLNIYAEIKYFQRRGVSKMSVKVLLN